MDDIERIALAFDAACRDAGVAYAFIGGMAVITWGQPRFTAALDSLVRVGPDRDEAFVAALRRAGLEVDGRDLVDARRDRSHVTVFDPVSPFHVDVKLASTPEEMEQIEAARVVPLGEGVLRIAAPEDTVAFKVLFGTPQDIQDARSILIRQKGRLDVGRLLRAAGRLGVLDAVQAMLREADA